MSNYREYIRTELLEKASRLFPNNPRLQMLYQIGFLEAQLGEAMRDDNKNYYRFRKALDRLDRKLR